MIKHAPMRVTRGMPGNWFWRCHRHHRAWRRESTWVAAMAAALAHCAEISP